MNPSFNFTQALTFLEAKGKEKLNPKFRIYPDDYETIFKLLVYFLKDTENAKKYGLSLRKGILLSGPIGCGKTSLMNLLRNFLPQGSRYILKSCREITYEFNKAGYTVIQNYSTLSYNNDKPKTYCFDDLGTETIMKYYGTDCNVMAEILLTRYDHFVTRKMHTHITTNLNSTEIEDHYGPRLRSRLREQFNLISFDSTTKDKRC